jgi:type IX secretion system PorP/SprF family membrane protein
MKRVTNLILVFTILFTGLVYGQQDPHYTQYMYNQNILNPAYAGSRGDLSIGLLARTQWVGIDGAPDTQTLNIHSAIGKGLGLGLSVIHDQIGPVEESNLALDVSYTLPVSDSGNLAFGVKGSFSFMNVGLFSQTDIIDATDVVFREDYKDTYPNVGAGLYYYTDKFYAGLSVPNILENYSYTLNGHLFEDVSDKMHWFGTMGYVFDLSENLKLKPSTMVKMVAGSPISIDLNASLFINELFEVGLSYRDGDSIDALLGVQASPNIRIGYAYDYTLTNLGNYNSGSHELMLLFDLDFAKKHIKSPRFF